MKALIQLLRPSHYIKNVFVFMPLFFAGRADNLNDLSTVAIAFVAFCLMASAVYVLNDISDIQTDKQHHKNKNRPLAAELITLKAAYCLLAICLILSLLLASSLSMDTLLLLLGYFALNVAYSIRLKHIPIVDISIISSGFVLRLFVGSTAVDVMLSQWIVIMTFLLALFLAISKRRDDVLIFEATGQKMRVAVDGYNLKFLDASISMLGAIIVVAYLMYVTSPEVAQRLGSDSLYLTSLFVVIGVLRYLHRTLVQQDTGSPTKIALSDRFMQATIILWVASFAWIIYL
ncbi:MAG: decaprenyl-phosphate phosphoribosyltransferase [Arenicella sp.]|jgi:decaprenyl-phosphate phosphoribosyltransferase